MKVIDPKVELLHLIDERDYYKAIELAGRICYQSEPKEEDSDIKFVRKMMKLGHDAMLEHAPSISMRFVCDRGVTHEIVRHRLFSFAQESTRYCLYSNEITVIRPNFWNDNGHQYKWENWMLAMKTAEETYIQLIRLGASAQEARSVLPNSLKTEIIVTGNIREWRHFFKLRTAKAAHPQMRQVAKQAFELLELRIPVLLEDIQPYIG